MHHHNTATLLQHHISRGYGKSTGWSDFPALLPLGYTCVSDRNPTMIVIQQYLTVVHPDVCVEWQRESEDDVERHGQGGWAGRDHCRYAR